MASDFIIAIGSHFSKRARVGCPSKTTDRNRKAIHDRKIRIMRNTLSQFLPQLLLHLPKISCLAGKGGASDLAYGRKPVRVISAKVSEDATVCIQPEKFTHHFNGQYFTISQGRLRTSLPQPPAD